MIDFQTTEVAIMDVPSMFVNVYNKRKIIYIDVMIKALLFTTAINKTKLYY